MGLKMQEYNDISKEDEIEVTNLFAMIWAHKLTIFCMSIIGIFIASYYVISADKKFTSAAIFTINDNDTRSPLSAGYSSIASLVGIDMGSASISIPLSEVMGREFILALDKTVNLQGDPFYNTHDPDAVVPDWKIKIKKIFGMENVALDTQSIIWQKISKKYHKSIGLESTEDDAIKVIVSHTDAFRSAEIANAIMSRLINSSENKKDREKDLQLSYLAQTLAKALSELEQSQNAIKNFTLQNSALPLEDFTADSFQLEALRENIQSTTILLNALTKLSSILNKSSESYENYLLLRKAHPIIDQVEFRRMLGQNELISSWTWPDLASVSAVSKTLAERKKRLEAKIGSVQVEAEIAGQAMQQYAKLKRNAQIAEATYTVLIEQVKAQSVVAGYRPEISEVYEYASVPLSPSEPNRNLILALGALAGIFLGCVLSLILASYRGVSYTISSITKAINANFNIYIRPIRSLRGHQINQTNKSVSIKSLSILRNLTIEIHKKSSPTIVITSSNSKLKGSEVAKALATYMQSDDLKLAIINFSQKTKFIQDSGSSDNFIKSEVSGNVTILQPNNRPENIELLSQQSFNKQIKSLNKQYNFIFCCADNLEAISLVGVLAGQDLFHMSIARRKHSRLKILKQLHSQLPIQGLLYE
jgi:uncharacterized protein involved in exopolysaccharide biosynthesis